MSRWKMALRWFRRIFLALVIITIATLFSLRPRAGKDGLPPAGFRSMTTLKLAFATGQLGLVDLKKPLPNNVDVQRGLEYAQVEGVALALDLYSPKGISRAAPCLIFIHGGGWRSGKREDYEIYTARFAAEGYVVASISYRLRNQALYPAAVEDAKAAVRWLRSHASDHHIDPDRVGVVGGSAGAHLAMMIAYASDQPQFDHGGNESVSSRVGVVVNLYGPVDLTTPYARNHELVTRFIGKSYEAAPDVYQAASPLTYVTPDDPPTLVFQGTLDDLVPVSQADTLVEALRKNNVPVIYERLEGWPHSMDVASVVNEFCFERMKTFFAEHLGKR